LILLINISCDKDSNCNNCGENNLGLTIIKVSENNLMQYEGLAQLKGIDMGTCIQASINQNVMTLGSVKILNECCCELRTK